jgi:hypothetical protein
MKDLILHTLKQHYEAEVSKHKMNIEIMLENPIAIPEHEAFISAMDKELELMTSARDKLETLIEKF